MGDSPNRKDLRLHRATDEACAADERCAVDGRRAAGVPRIDEQDIFRQLIVDEIRNGRLTRSRRKRIVRYAARLRLNAVQAGRLIEQCRQEVSRSDDPAHRAHALRLVEPVRPLIPTTVKIWSVIAVAIVLDILLVGWLL